jgi:hypothetical protein
VAFSKISNCPNGHFRAVKRPKIIFYHSFIQNVHQSVQEIAKNKLYSKLWTLGRFEIGILARYRNQSVQTSNQIFSYIAFRFYTLKEFILFAGLKKLA